VLSYVSVIYFRNARINSKSATNALRTMIAVSIKALNAFIRFAPVRERDLPSHCLYTACLAGFSSVLVEE
ncbi:hypothetical protein LWT34_24055, partial [Enterobacter ludwigii]